MFKYIQDLMRSILKESAKSKIKRRKPVGNSNEITSEKTPIPPDVLAQVLSEKYDIENSPEFAKLINSYDLLMKKFANPNLGIAFPQTTRKRKGSVRFVVPEMKSNKKANSLPVFQKCPNLDVFKTSGESSAIGWSGQVTQKISFKPKIEAALHPNNIASALLQYTEMFDSSLQNIDQQVKTKRKRNPRTLFSKRKVKMFDFEKNFKKKKHPSKINKPINVLKTDDNIDTTHETLELSKSDHSKNVITSNLEKSDNQPDLNNSTNCKQQTFGLDYKNVMDSLVLINTLENNLCEFENCENKKENCRKIPTNEKDKNKLTSSSNTVTCQPLIPTQNTLSAENNEKKGGCSDFEIVTQKDLKKPQSNHLVKLSFDNNKVVEPSNSESLPLESEMSSTEKPMDVASSTNGTTFATVEKEKFAIKNYSKQDLQEQNPPTTSNEYTLDLPVCNENYEYMKYKAKSCLKNDHQTDKLMKYVRRKRNPSEVNKDDVKQSMHTEQYGGKDDTLICERKKQTQILQKNKVNKKVDNITSSSKYSRRNLRVNDSKINFKSNQSIRSIESFDLKSREREKKMLEKLKTLLISSEPVADVNTSKNIPSSANNRSATPYKHNFNADLYTIERNSNKKQRNYRKAGNTSSFENLDRCVISTKPTQDKTKEAKKRVVLLDRLASIENNVASQEVTNRSQSFHDIIPIISSGQKKQKKSLKLHRYREINTLDETNTNQSDFTDGQRKLYTKNSFRWSLQKPSLKMYGELRSEENVYKIRSLTQVVQNQTKPKSTSNRKHFISNRKLSRNKCDVVNSTLQFLLPRTHSRTIYTLEHKTSFSLDVPVNNRGRSEKNTFPLISKRTMIKFHNMTSSYSTSATAFVESEPKNFTYIKRRQDSHLVQTFCKEPAPQVAYDVMDKHVKYKGKSIGTPSGELRVKSTFGNRENIINVKNKQEYVKDNALCKNSCDVQKSDNSITILFRRQDKGIGANQKHFREPKRKLEPNQSCIPLLEICDKLSPITRNFGSYDNQPKDNTSSRLENNQSFTSGSKNYIESNNTKCSKQCREIDTSEITSKDNSSSNNSNRPQWKSKADRILSWKIHVGKAIESESQLITKYKTRVGKVTQTLPTNTKNNRNKPYPAPENPTSKSKHNKHPPKLVNTPPKKKDQEKNSNKTNNGNQMNVESLNLQCASCNSRLVEENSKKTYSNKYISPDKTKSNNSFKKEMENIINNFASPICSPQINTNVKKTKPKQKLEASLPLNRVIEHSNLNSKVNDLELKEDKALNHLLNMYNKSEAKKDVKYTDCCQTPCESDQFTNLDRAVTYSFDHDLLSSFKMPQLKSEFTNRNNSLRKEFSLVKTKSINTSFENKKAEEMHTIPGKHNKVEFKNKSLLTAKNNFSSRRKKSIDKAVSESGNTVKASKIMPIKCLIKSFTHRSISLPNLRKPMQTTLKKLKSTLSLSRENSHHRKKTVQIFHKSEKINSNFNKPKKMHISRENPEYYKIANKSSRFLNKETKLKVHSDLELPKYKKYREDGELIRNVRGQSRSYLKGPFNSSLLSSYENEKRSLDKIQTNLARKPSYVFKKEKQEIPKVRKTNIVSRCLSREEKNQKSVPNVSKSSNAIWASSEAVKLKNKFKSTNDYKDLLDKQIEARQQCVKNQNANSLKTEISNTTFNTSKIVKTKTKPIKKSHINQPSPPTICTSEENNKLEKKESKVSWFGLRRTSWDLSDEFEGCMI